MKQNIEIEVPEGCAAVFDAASMKIVITKKDSLPKSWEDVEKLRFEDTYFYKIDSCNSEICALTNNRYRPTYFDNEAEAEAIVAFFKLLRLRKLYIGEWKPNWNNSSVVYTIYSANNVLGIYESLTCNRVMSFPTKDLAQKFFTNFYDLLNKAKDLI